MKRLGALLAVGGLALTSLPYGVLGAAQVIPSLSFGHNMPLSRESVLQGWSAMGDGGHVPPILPDRIILTPPYPGNRRGWLWSQTGNRESEWQVDFEFRAHGPEHGDGNLQLWYAQDGPGVVGASSIYNVGRFTGLAIAVDQYAGLGGTVRAFLNDGSKDYQSMGPNVDSQAIGLCKFPYRDTGFFIPMTLKNSAKGLEVLINGQNCISSETIRLPPGYYFGITATSAEEPDSFEVAKFVTYQLPNTPGAPPQSQQQQQQQQQQQGQAQHQNLKPPRNANPETWSESRDAPASAFANEEARFKDLHDRLTVVNHQLNALTRAVNDLFAAIGPHINAGSENAVTLLQRTEHIDHQLRKILEQGQHLENQHTQAQKAAFAELREHVSTGVHNQLNDHSGRIHSSVQQSHTTLMISIRNALKEIINTDLPPNTFGHLVYAGLCQGVGVVAVLFPALVAYRRFVRREDDYWRKKKYF